MSLAMYAAPFDNDINTINNNKDSGSSIERKKNTNSKTQKRAPKENFQSERVNSILQKIHNLPDQDDSLADFNPDFNPPPFPNSVGIERKENTVPYAEGERVGDESYESNYRSQSEEVNMGTSSRVPDDYYRRFMPNYNNIYKGNAPYIPVQQPRRHIEQHYAGSTNDILIEKLNYMINLLEEQKDERTGNVTEEVILYSFLGIFIIFIADSFVRVGKYVR